MKPSGNFLSATLLDDAPDPSKVLHVEGTSNEDVKDVHVLVHRADPNRGETVTAKLGNPPDGRWPVDFPDTEPPFERGERIFVVGLALKAAGGPFAWTSVLTIN